MYKAKFKIWISMILLSAFIFNFSTIMTTLDGWMPKGTTTYNVYMDVNEHSLISKFEGYKKSGAILKNVATVEEAYAVVANASDKTITGYVKYAEQFYSPIAMFVPYSVYKEGDAPGFKTRSTNSHYYLEKDLKPLLEALEQEKTWEDIGLVKYFGKGNVDIVIPKTGAENYNTIYEYIKFVLNDYSFDNFNNKELNDRTNNVIAKCSRYEDAADYIIAICDAGRKGINTIVLAPEYIVRESYHIGGTSNSSYSYIICYTPKTTALSYDLFVKEQDTNNSTMTLLKSLRQKKFVSSTGLRNVDITFNIYDVDGFYYNNPFIVEVKKPSGTVSVEPTKVEPKPTNET